MSTDSDTLVSGSPSGLRAPKVGDVLAERYEIRQTVSTDPLVLTYRAVDHESENAVLLRAITPGRLNDIDAARMVETMRDMIGVGGPTLQPLRDAERDGSIAFTVEVFPRGLSFRSVLNARREKKKAFTGAELLPLATRLVAALSGFPEPHFHGDVRAERVFVDRDGIRLTGAFLLSVVPGDVIRDAMGESDELAEAFAPEVADGLNGRPSDRYGLARIIWEALSGEPPTRKPVPPAAWGPLGPVLVRYLDVDAALRPPTYDTLIAALAQHAAKPVPEIPTESFVVRSVQAPTENTRREPSSTETGSFILGDGDVLEVPNAKPISEPPKGAAKAPNIPRSGVNVIDPKAIARAVESAKITENAKPATTKESEPLRAEPAGDDVAPRAESGPRARRDPSGSVSLQDRAVAIVDDGGLDYEDVGETQRNSKARSSEGLSIPTPPAPSRLSSRPVAVPRPSSVPPPPDGGAAGGVAIPPPARVPREDTETPTQVPRASMRPSMAPRATQQNGPWVIVIAVLIAAIILAFAVVYRRMQDESHRQRVIEERLRQLQAGEGDSNHDGR